MPDLSDFFNSFVSALRDAEKTDPTFRARFNNSPEHKRAKTCSPRTDLMMGTANARNGILTETLKSFLQLDKQDLTCELSYDRYMDFIAFKGNWFEGQRIALATVEIENNLNEFMGTFSDLVRYQSQHKLGVFYDAMASDNFHRNKIEEHVRNVLDNFQRQGFVEAEETEYLIVLGPAHLTEGVGIGEWSAVRFTPRFHGSLSDCWLGGAAQSRTAGS
jgi:hypothetical protein